MKSSNNAERSVISSYFIFSRLTFICWMRSNHCLSNFIECCLVVSNIIIVKETIIDPLGDRVGWCRWPFFWNRDFLPTHHTGCGRHSTTANVGMPLAPLCLPSNPLSSRQLKVPQGASTGATTPCERHGSMAAVEPLVVRIGTEQCHAQCYARNAAHTALHCTVRAPHSSSTGGSWCLVISQQALSGDEQFNICSDNGHCI